MQRRLELAPIPFLLCFDLVHRLDLLFSVGGRPSLRSFLDKGRFYPPDDHCQPRPRFSPYRLQVDGGRMSLDISRWWPWRVIFFYDSFVATKEGEWTFGGHVSMMAVPERTGHKSSCQPRASRESCLAWCQHKTDLSFLWDGENDGLGTHLLLFARVRCFFAVWGYGVSKSRI